MTYLGAGMADKRRVMQNEWDYGAYQQEDQNSRGGPNMPMYRLVGFGIGRRVEYSYIQSIELCRDAQMLWADILTSHRRKRSARQKHLCDSIHDTTTMRIKACTESSRVELSCFPIRLIEDILSVTSKCSRLTVEKKLLKGVTMGTFGGDREPHQPTFR